MAFKNIKNNNKEVENTNNKNTDLNFDLQQVINIVGQSAMTTNQISTQLGIVTTCVNGLRDDVNKITDRMLHLENNEEITTTQQETIIELAKKRVCEILDFDNVEISKYIRTFIQKLYSDTRTYAGLGSKIARTRKSEYQRVIDYVEAWTPRCGTSELKCVADTRAKSRREAKDMGYDC